MMRGLPFILLALIAAGFGSIAATPWRTGQAITGAPPAPPAPPPSAPDLTLPPRQVTDFAPFLGRPPFSAARRPPPPEAAGVPIAAPDPTLLFGQYEVAGVVMLGTSVMAMLRGPSGTLLRIRAGDRVETLNDDADVIEITLKTLTFRHQGDTVIFPVGQGGTKTE